MEPHSILPPSSADKWVNCSGWVGMSAWFPEESESAAAREGTAVHELGQLLIESGGEPIGLVSASNGIVFTEDMFSAARLYANEVLAVKRARPHATLGTETRLDGDRIHKINFGTCDAHLWDARTKDLYVWDLKYGHSFVDAYENWQLINYTALLMDYYSISEDTSVTLHLRIVQPRNYDSKGPIREWRVQASDLRGRINIMSNKAIEAVGPDARTQSGPHCLHCSARHACDAAIRAGMSLYEASWFPTPMSMSLEAQGIQYAIMLRARAQLDLLMSGFEEQIKKALSDGKTVPGWTLAQGKGRTVWNRPLDEVFALGEMFGIDVKVESAITPKQAIDKGLDATLVAAYSVTPSTGVKLVADNMKKAEEVFLR